MTDLHPLAGVYAAAVTPLLDSPAKGSKLDSNFDLEAVPALLRHLAASGCHGALLFGTTGEGPSFSPKEREVLLRSVRVYRQQLPGFKLLAGTGTPSLSETIELTKLTFDLGYDGVVVLPPYYFRKAADEGLFKWFSELITKAVPAHKYLLGYHIPSAAGIGFSLDLIARLKDAFPNQFAGIKDSSHDEAFSAAVGQRFGRDLLVLNGTDSHFHHALKNHAQGAITAMANLIGSDLRDIWDLYNEGGDPSEIQVRVAKQRHALEKYTPFPPTLKALLHKLHSLPRWTVRPPLEDISPELEDQILQGWESLQV
ncbi:MAG TPA: dihydrodipicolinate synthase family protein [Anaerolineales bacterium]|nr:dihydrodipicolinate synthase family protein [Anaerolineales bacterium]HMX17835.1 dihydrodipicolinate synthase family protein [Anaerolineales bacterium]HMX72844.1 dihydrodipicolinate synthase family protein [Anaerolineales bacterium]HMZ43281.1 dihydrodipicolinate synthase family protein [Anaerolineales bacterium]HNA53272.1 dihydrodipicolinate synthase family protein [Anaerolineales bacterium]